MKSLLTLAFALLAFLPQAHAMEKEAMMKDAMHKAPAVKAVVFFSENCGACKVLDPKMKAAMQAVNMDKIDVVMLDFTSKESIEIVRKTAAEKGLDPILQKFGAKTGFVTLVDGNGAIVDKIGKDDTEAQIASKLVTAVLNAS